MWPDARLKDKEMFTHLNFEFDLGRGKITGETAAKDYHGVPVYQYIYDTIDKSAVEITNVEDEGIKEVPVALPSADISDKAEADDLFTQNDVLSLEEQRDVAFKVTSFFIMLILASFAILYIYHRSTQRRSRGKMTFFEFLAGELDDTYPAINNQNNARYQI